MEIKLNLTSKPYLNRQSLRLWLFFACALMVLLLIFNCFYLYQNYRQLAVLDDHLIELESQVAGEQGVPAGYTPERYSAVRSEVARANEIVSADQFRWTPLLSRFEELLPADVSIRMIQPDFKEGSLQLTCIARDVPDMTQFIDNLLDSADLNQAFLQRHSEVETELDGRKQFHVGFTLLIRGAF